MSTRELLALAHQLAGEDGGLAADLEQLALQPRDAALQVLARLLDGPRLAHADEGEEEDDGPEPAADAVEEREAEDLDVAARPAPHGQSFEGVMNEPRVTMASFQNAGAAMGSPSIGKSRTFTGTPRGQRSHRAVEELEAVAAGDGAPAGRGQSLRGQAVGEER